jgi:hypothetical protein
MRWEGEMSEKKHPAFDMRETEDGYRVVFEDANFLRREIKMWIDDEIGQEVLMVGNLALTPELAAGVVAYLTQWMTSFNFEVEDTDTVDKP